MSNQDLIDYLNSITTQNNATIDNLNLQITNYQMLIDGYNQTITTTQGLITDSQNQITQLGEDNTMIQDIIAFIPPDASAKALKKAVPSE